VYSLSMPTEIERKFLVDPTKLPKPSLRVHLHQGYMSLASPVVRVRIQEYVEPPIPPQAFLTIKGPGSMVRPEFEYSIPLEHAREMWPMVKFEVRKWRSTIPCYEISNVNKHWSVDEFLGPLQGLWVAEIELDGPDDPVVLEPWLGREVTDDPRYANTWLAEHGIPV